MASPLKTGVFIDVANIATNGGFGMRYDVLRQFSCRDGAEPIRLNAYATYDPERAESDAEYSQKQRRFHAAVRDYGFKVIQKDAVRQRDDAGNESLRANAELELAVEALVQSDKLDRVVLASGNGDFTRVVRVLQSRGCRVEVVAFDNVSDELRREADLYVSGYLIPNLLPVQVPGGSNAVRWGEVGSYVRGVCYAYDPVKNFGWLRFLKQIGNELWRTDNRDPQSPYSTIFCHDSEFPQEVSREQITQRKFIFEFKIETGQEPGKTKAVEVEAIPALT